MSQSEQRRILELLASQQITVAEAEELLGALGQSPAYEQPVRRSARLIRINVDAEDEAKVRVNVPIALAKFAMNLIPKEARGELEVQGIDLNALVAGLFDGEVLPEGRLVDLEAVEKGKTVKIVIEVV